MTWTNCCEAYDSRHFPFCFNQSLIYYFMSLSCFIYVYTKCFTCNFYCVSSCWQLTRLMCWEIHYFLFVYIATIGSLVCLTEYTFDWSHLMQHLWLEKTIICLGVQSGMIPTYLGHFYFVKQLSHLFILCLYPFAQ